MEGKGKPKNDWGPRPPLMYIMHSHDIAGDQQVVISFRIATHYEWTMQNSWSESVVVGCSDYFMSKKKRASFLEVQPFRLYT